MSGDGGGGTAVDMILVVGIIVVRLIRMGIERRSSLREMTVRNKRRRSGCMTITWGILNSKKYSN